MPIVDVPFGEWLPSAPDFKNPGCLVADNIIPSTGGDGPRPAIVAQGDKVTGTVRGAVELFDNAGTSLIVGGTDSRLFIYRSAIVETIGYTDPGNFEAWDFAQFNDFVIATSANNAPQYLTDINSDNAWSALTGSPPNAKRCAKVGEFLMMGSVSGTPNRIQWSAYNDPAGSWSGSRTTQAGYKDLPAEFGEVQKIVGGRFATVFQKKGITRVSYVGPPTVWRTDTISRDRGTIAPFSVVVIGYQSFFLAQDGFYVTDGASFAPIGTRRVNKWFFENVAQESLALTQGTVDWQNECIVWKFQSDQSSTFDRMIYYSWAQDRWTTATVGTGWIVGTALDVTSIDALDAVYGDLDSITLSLDAKAFQAKEGVLGAFVTGSPQSEYNTFNGEPAVATWETGEFQPSPGRRVFVDEVTPIMTAGTWDAQATLITRDSRGAETSGAAKTAGWSGFCPVRGEGTKMRVKLSKPAGTAWDEAQGVQVKYRAAGTR